MTVGCGSEIRHSPKHIWDFVVSRSEKRTMKKLNLFLIIVGLLIAGCTQSATQPAADSQVESSVVVAEPVTGPAASPTPAFTPPGGYQEYVDAAAGISIFIPDTWIISQTTAGQYAILQSYPIDKYIGGEGLQPGDTKCDLIIKDAENTGEIIRQWTSDSLTTVVSDETFQLRDGVAARKLVLDSMGRSTGVFADIDGRAVILSCYGAFELFDTIAATLGALSSSAQ